MFSNHTLSIVFLHGIIILILMSYRSELKFRKLYDFQEKEKYKWRG